MTGDFKFESNLEKGNRGKKVRFAQGLLAVNRIYTAIDGGFGPATEFAVVNFQEDQNLPATGIIDEATFNALLAPITRAVNSIEPAGRTLGDMVLAYGEQHHRELPREVGGQNMGPWVQLYMKGNEGSEWPWCAGFVCFLLDQACKSLSIPMPLKESFSCDSLAAHAKDKGIFVTEARVKAGENCVTINLDIQYTAPARGDRFVCRAWVRHRSGRIVYTRAEVTDDAGQLVAAGQGAFRVVKAPL